MEMIIALLSLTIIMCAIVLVGTILQLIVSTKSTTKLERSVLIDLIKAFAAFTVLLYFVKILLLRYF